MWHKARTSDLRAAGSRGSPLKAALSNMAARFISSISLTSRVLNKCSPQEGNLFVFDNNRLTLNCPWALTSADKISSLNTCELCGFGYLFQYLEATVSQS